SPEPIGAERAEPAVGIEAVHERRRLECLVSRPAVRDACPHEIVTILENRGTHLDRGADRPLDGMSAPVECRSDLLDHHARELESGCQLRHFSGFSGLAGRAARRGLSWKAMLEDDERGEREAKLGRESFIGACYTVKPAKRR